MRDKKERKHRDFSKLIASLISIGIGMIAGLIVLLITKSENAWDGFMVLLSGGIPSGGLRAFGNIFYLAIPIMMTGLGVAFAFKAGVFNIGGPGQFIVGAYVAIFTAIRWEWLPGALRWIVPLFAAAIAGALWALIPGLLKAYVNVNVVISTIMMNYIGMFLVNYLVKETVFDGLKGQSQSIPAAAQLPKAGLDKIFPGSSLHVGIFIAIGVCILIHIVLNKTVFGYEIKACGMNPDACKYAGISEKRTVVLSIIISGAVIGLGGALLFITATGKHIIVVDKLAAEGFTGIAVALLAGSSPLGVILSAIFVGYITVGGQFIQLFGYVPEIIDIIIAVVIYFCAFVLLIRDYILSSRLRKAGREGRS